MRLRARLVLGVVATAVPLTIGLALLQTRVERRRSLERVADIAIARMGGDVRERCEAEPATFPSPRGGRLHGVEDVLGLLELAEPPRRRASPRTGPRGRRGEGPRLFAYDEGFRSANPRAPALPRALVAPILAGDDASLVVEGRGRHAMERALVRMPWSGGPCALVLVEHPAAGPERLRPRVVIPLFVVVGIVVVVLLVAFPMERRIRRLTEVVHAGRAREAADDAADEIGELARALATREARIAEQMAAISGREQALRDYIANTTHDVLAPVAVLKTQLAEIEQLVRSGEPVPRALAIDALEETHYLTGLVHNLNAQARLDAGLAASRARIDLAVVTERAVSRHAPLAARQGIAIDFAVPDGPVHVLGDVTLVEQALSNLVGNAVRYNREGGHVAVVLATRGPRFRLEVLDDGPGVAPDARARLGERGFRTNDARTRRPEGMGLGLHIVREVAAAHGFALEFEANEPSGMRVVIEGDLDRSVP